MTPIPRHEQRQLERWFTFDGADVHSVGGAVENAGPLVHAIREHRRDHNRRVRELRAELRAAGSAPRPSDPWDPLPVTARPTTTRTRREPAYELDEVQLIESGRVRRRLDQLSPLDAGTLGVVFGTIGWRYEHGNQLTDHEAQTRASRPRTPARIVGNVLIDDQPDDYGQLPRVYALVHALKPGRELLATADKLLPRIDSQDYERVRLVLLLRDRDEYQPLQQLIESAIIAAELRFARAAAAWNATSPNVGR